MSIANEISRLQKAKADLKTAIEGKGVTVPSSTKLDGYADLVDSISGGGSEPLYVYMQGYANPYLYKMVPDWDTIKNVVANAQRQIIVTFLDSKQRTLLVEGPFEKGIFFDYGISHLNSLSSISIIEASSLGVSFTIINNNDNGNYGFYGVEPVTPCFVKGTKITLSNGEKKAVEDITYKDNLLVWDFDLGEKSQAEPLWITNKLVANNYKLVTLDDGKQMKLVGAGEDCHRLFCIEDREFVHANNMVGKTTIYEDGTQHKVISCEVINDNVEYYNIITDYHMNLYAEDVLTSCRYSNMYPIEDMRYVKDGRTIRPQSEYNVEDKYYYGLRLGESQIELDKTLRYINNLKFFEKK